MLDSLRFVGVMLAISGLELAMSAKDINTEVWEEAFLLFATVSFQTIMLIMKTQCMKTREGGSTELSRASKPLVMQATSTIAFSSTAIGAFVGAVTYWSLIVAEKMVCSGSFAFMFYTLCSPNFARPIPKSNATGAIADTRWSARSSGRSSSREWWRLSGKTRPG